MRRSPRVNQEVLLRATFFGWSAGLFFKNGKTGCLLRLSGGVERGARDVTVLVPSKAGGRANPGSGPCHLSGVRTGERDQQKKPSGHCVAGGSGSGAPEDPAL